MNTAQAEHAPLPSSTRRRAGWQVAASVAALVAFALGMAACGSGPADIHAGSGSTTSTVSSAGPGSSPPSSSNSTLALEFARCMRAHGVSGFPDPPSPGSSPSAGNSYDPNSPTAVAAEQACQKYADSKVLPSAVLAQIQAEQLKYAECMQAHGEPNFPDPSANGAFSIPNSIDQNSATFKSAESACKSLRPLGGAAPGGG